jgi:omega-6 fatty acid desaturase (delta-12 desaturase)
MPNTLNQKIKPFAKPSTSRAVYQMLNTIIPFFLLIVGMYYMVVFNVSYIFVVLVSIVPALFLVRIFIMFHDCTHKSFLSSNRAMMILGHIFGILTFTPFYKWQKDHITHHRTVGNLEKRGIGDVWMMTTDEYEQASLMKKVKYRMYRNPFILFIIGPIFLFLIGQRFPSVNTKKVWLSTMITNVGILAIIVTISLTVGFNYYLLIQLPIIFFAAIVGVWLFYIQHQYEDV